MSWDSANGGIFRKTAPDTADYGEDFKNLDAMIKKEGNLVPEMYRNCEDFTVAVEF